MTAKTARKLGLKESYTLMTRDLAWDTSYQPMDKVYPQVAYEGLKIHDWDRIGYDIPLLCGNVVLE